MKVRGELLFLGIVLIIAFGAYSVLGQDNSSSDQQLLEKWLQGQVNSNNLTVDTLLNTVKANIREQRKLRKKQKEIDKLTKDLHKESLKASPIGSIKVWVSKRVNQQRNDFLPPNGWFICNGQTIDITEDRKNLLKALNQPANLTKLQLPDFRGVFLRGLDYPYPGHGVRGRDPQQNRQPGDYQPDDFKKHNHQYSKSAGKDRHGYGDYPNIHHKFEDKTTGDRGGLETRPKNVAVHWIIRVE